MTQNRYTELPYEVAGAIRPVATVADLPTDVTEGAIAYVQDVDTLYTFDGATWSAVASGTGDIVGPASATDNAIARFDSTTGKLLQNSVVLVGDTGNVTGVGTIGASGAITVSVGNNVPALTINNSGPTMTIQCFAGVKLEFVTSGAFLQFNDLSDGNAQIIARGTKHLLLACDGTNAGKGVIVQGSSGQTAKLLDVQLSDTTSIMSIAVNGNTLINTTTGAFSPPRMTTTQRDNLTATNGMMIYNTTDDKFNVREGGAWVALVTL